MTDTGRTPELDTLSPTHLLAIAFKSQLEAESALSDVKELAEWDFVKIDDACIVQRNDDGSLRVQETHDAGFLGGSWRGAVAGTLVGILVAVPVAGLVAGAAIGAVTAARGDPGIQREFQNRIGIHLKPGMAALILVVTGADRATALRTARRWDGEMIWADLDDDTAAALREALAATPSDVPAA